MNSSRLIPIDGFPLPVDSNAIKYTHGGGRVTVELKQDDNCVDLSVQDSGIGMILEECEKIWFIR